MSRSGYSDDFGDDDPLALGRWRAAVNSAINGKRGQAFLREFIADLDAMPVKRLIAESFADNATGEVCSLGAVFAARGLEQPPYDPDGYEEWEVGEDAAKRLQIAGALAHEIIYMNDEGSIGHYEETGDPIKPRRYVPETPEQRWDRMRRWAVRHLKDASPSITGAAPAAEPKSSGEK